MRSSQPKVDRSLMHMEHQVGICFIVPRTARRGRTGLDLRFALPETAASVGSDALSAAVDRQTARACQDGQ